MVILCDVWQGTAGFKGAKRSTTYAAQMAGALAAKVRDYQIIYPPMRLIAIQNAKEKGVDEVRVQIKGMGSGRAVRLHANFQPRETVPDLHPLEPRTFTHTLFSLC